MEKRVLPTPTPSKMADFITIHTDNATAVDLIGDQPTALTERLTNRRLSMTVKGLWGCTSVIIVSKKGVYMSHFWEGYFHWDVDVSKRVLYPLLEGEGPSMPALFGVRDQFNQDSEPTAIIITPSKYPIRWKREIERSVQELEYPKPVGRIAGIFSMISCR